VTTALANIHPRAVAHNLGILLMILGMAMLTPIPWSLIDQDGSWKALLQAGILTSSCGGALSLWGKRPEQLRRRDTFLLVTLAWVCAAAAGALPYLFSGVMTTYTDAFFESMSGFSTTGSSVLTNIEVVPGAILLWRSMSQWLGGMGIMVLVVAVLSALGVGGLQVMRAEAPGPVVERLFTRVRETARALWLAYVALTITLVLILIALDMTLFDALNHSFTTMATGGFGTKNASMGAFSPTIQWVTTLFMFMAGVNFALFVGAISARNPALFWRDPEFRLYLGLTGGAITVIAVIVFANGLQWAEALRHSAFQVVSVITTTGFVTADYSQWPVGAQAILGLLALCGASAGSTGGGVKVVRYLVLIKQGAKELALMVQPKSIRQIRLDDRVIPEEMVAHIHQFFFLYMVSLGLGFLVLSATGLDAISSLSAAATTLGNIGPGAGVIGPVNNFAALTDTAKWTCSILMLLGRLELYTVLVIFSPTFWRQ